MYVQYTLVQQYNNEREGILVHPYLELVLRTGRGLMKLPQYTVSAKNATNTCKHDFLPWTHRLILVLQSVGGAQYTSGI